MEQVTPELLDEIRGIAEGAGLDFDTMLVFEFMDEYLVHGEAIAAEHCSSLGWPQHAAVVRIGEERGPGRVPQWLSDTAAHQVPGNGP